LIFAGPGIGASQSARQIAETVDIYPTLLALAGMKRAAGMQPLDGMDLAPALKNPSQVTRPYAYHAYPRPGRIGQAIRTDRYRLVRWTQEATGNRSYELYDLEADPGETRNQADALPAVRADLEAYLDAQPKPVSVRIAAERPGRASD
jgi:iduronate 2-sulfatase